MLGGIFKIKLAIDGAGNLKEKRRALKSLITRLQNRFKIAVAEIAHQNVWRSATIGMALVSNAGRHLQEVKDKIVSYITMDQELRIVSVIVDDWTDSIKDKKSRRYFMSVRRFI